MAILYDWLNFNVQYIRLIKCILLIPSGIRTFFFFPFYHTGGAELVHLNIVKAMQGKTVTFFTLPSANSHFLSEFQKHSTCYCIEKMIRSTWRKKLFMRCISFKLNRRENVTVFGCHSLFFYELLPYLKNDVQCIDLIHAFTHPEEPGFEKVSIHYLQRLNKRVTISQKGKSDLIAQYENLDIPSGMADKIQVIYNSINFSCTEIPKKATDVFNVVYVGRNSPEKRVSLMGNIASELKKINAAFNFIFVGEHLDQGVDLEDRSSCVFIGNIVDLGKLEQIYRNAHVVLIASTREGIPMSLVEGMTFGAVPVSTNVGAISELIEHNVNGKLIPLTHSKRNEKTMFVSEIVQLREDALFWQLCSQNSFHRANRFFSEGEFSRRYKEILQA